MSTLIFSILFGSIGTGFFIYGRKQKRPIPLIAGIGLCVFPYVIANVYAMALVGAALTATPWLAGRILA